MTLTSLSSNFGYATISAIRAEERLHWYLGLRKAELILESSLKPALQFSILDKNKLIRDRKSLISIEVKDDDIDDKIIRITEEIRQIEMLIPDTVLEIQLAEAERDRIVSEHPESLELSKVELQRRYSRDCYLARATRVIATASMRQMGYSDGEASLINELPVEDQLEIFSKLQPQNHRIVAALSNCLNRLSPLEAQKILGQIESLVNSLMLTGENKDGIASRH